MYLIYVYCVISVYGIHRYILKYTHIKEEPKGNIKMKAAHKTAVIHDYNVFQLNLAHVDYLVEIFEMKMNSVASIGAQSATFLTDDIAIATTWGVTGYELRLELLIENGQHLWIGDFHSVTEANKELKILGSLE